MNGGPADRCLLIKKCSTGIIANALNLLLLSFLVAKLTVLGPLKPRILKENLRK
jgi:hypothetical protein